MRLPTTATARFTNPETRQETVTPQRQARERKIKQAMAFLREVMGDVPRPAAEIEALGIAQGFTHSTLRDARKRAHITTEKRGKQWVWIPPKSRRKQAVKVMEEDNKKGKGQKETY